MAVTARWYSGCGAKRPASSCRQGAQRQPDDTTTPFTQADAPKVVWAVDFVLGGEPQPTPDMTTSFQQGQNPYLFDVYFSWGTSNRCWTSPDGPSPDLT